MARRGVRRACDAAFALTLAAAPGELAAEPALSLSIASDDRFRGESTSDGRPVVTGTLAYDDVRGPYFGTSVTAGATRNDGVRLLRAVQYAGYARRLSSSITLDAGVSHHAYSRHATFEYAPRFAQFYIGLVGRRVSTRMFVAPGYERDGGGAGYAEVDALLFSRGDWSLSGHVGVLAPERRAAEVDWRLGLSRRLGRLGLSATLVGHRDTRNIAAVIAATRNF